MSDLVHISLFSGVGGIDLAMHNAGIPTVHACEYDKAARGVLADRFPDAELSDDVRTLTGDHLRRLADPRRTVLSAGFPCQDLSVAGARRGMVEGSGTRSALFWEVDRLLGEFRPAWVVLENVPGLLSSREGRDMGAVLGSLGQRGYGFAYRVLDARHFGVPQRRRRVVIVGRLGDDGRAPAQVLLEPEGLRGDSAAGITPRPRPAGRARGGVGTGRVTSALTTRSSVALDDQQTDQLVVGVVAPQVAATLTAGTSRPGISALGRRQEDDHNVYAFHMTQDPISGGVSPAMGAKSGGMGIAYAAEQTVALDTAQGGPDDNSAQGGHLVAEYRTELTVRRLTPTECERLQGFPDGHTATSNGRPQSDSPRYKQMGNAVAVPVFEWVARRIAAVDAAKAVAA